MTLHITAVIFCYCTLQRVTFFFENSGRLRVVAINQPIYISRVHNFTDSKTVIHCSYTLYIHNIQLCLVSSVTFPFTRTRFRIR